MVYKVEKTEGGTPMAMDDKTFKQLKKRDESAFLEMMRQHKNTVYYTALTYLKNQEKALEAVQEVTFRAYKNCYKIKKASAIKAWLTRITINYCLDEIKKNKKVQQNEEFIQEVAQKGQDQSTSIVLSEAIQTLKPKYQIVVLMKYQQDMTIQAISESLSLPQGTIKTYLNRGLKELKGYLKKGGFDEYESKEFFQ